MLSCENFEGKINMLVVVQQSHRLKTIINFSKFIFNSEKRTRKAQARAGAQLQQNCRSY